MSEILSTRQAATLAGISYYEMNILLRFNSIPCQKRGTNYIVLKSDLNKWIAKNKKEQACACHKDG